MEYVRAGDVCVDVGANIGYFTAIMARLASASGKVLSFEPVPENFSILKVNAGIADVDGAKVTAINAAVSERPGMVKIIRREYSTYHQIEPNAEPGCVDAVKGVCLDEELQHLIPRRRVNFTKIDVEGHELRVLRGLKQTLAAGRVEKLVIEVTPGSDAEEMEAILATHARCMECWVDGEWRAQSIRDLKERTDVFVDCTTR
jgi:FkbM family methyltransferase